MTDSRLMRRWQNTSNHKEIFRYLSILLMHICTALFIGKTFLRLTRTLGEDQFTVIEQALNDPN